MTQQAGFNTTEFVSLQCSGYEFFEKLNFLVLLDSDGFLRIDSSQVGDLIVDPNYFLI